MKCSLLSCRITSQKLQRVAAAENVVRSLGARQVRVRHHGNLARVEVDSGDIGLLTRPDVREDVARALRALGFVYVTLDLLGFRSGSMNEPLANQKADSESI